MYVRVPTDGSPGPQGRHPTLCGAHPCTLSWEKPGNRPLCTLQVRGWGRCRSSTAQRIESVPHRRRCCRCMALACQCAADGGPGAASVRQQGTMPLLCRNVKREGPATIRAAWPSAVGTQGLRRWETQCACVFQTRTQRASNRGAQLRGRPRGACERLTSCVRVCVCGVEGR